MRVVGAVAAWLLAIWTSLLYLPLRWRPLGLFLFAPKVAANALVGVIAVLGALLASFGLARRSPLVTIPAGLASAAAALVIWRISRARADLDRHFGEDWTRHVPAHRRARMLQRRLNIHVPEAPDVRWERDVAFATVPESGRALLCDIWQPPPGVEPSGLGFIYLFGSAWYILDKDIGTRPLFNHLAAQGHVIMDVAYRLYPETDISGMVGDAKRAVEWLKRHAGEYGVRPERIVLGGGSAGGHLALLAAYAPDHPELTPPDLADIDLSVSGAVSLYGQADLAAMYYHTDQQISTKADDPKPDWDAPPPQWMLRLFGESARHLGLQKMMTAGRLDWLVGGTPEEVPDRYALQSPIRHVHPECPPTLLIHGEHDMMAPVVSTRELYRKLQRADVPAAMMTLPHTDHAFDMLFWRSSPAAQVAVYELERFLAVIAAHEEERRTSDPGAA